MSVLRLPAGRSLGEGWRKSHRWVQIGRKVGKLFYGGDLAGYSSHDQKLTLIQRAISKTDLLKYFLQLIWEMKLVDDKKYLSVAQPVNEVGKQLGGWRQQLTRSA